jgi:hypothetical protein
MSKLSQNELAEKYLDTGIMIIVDGKKKIRHQTINRNLKSLVSLMELDVSKYFNYNWKTVHLLIDQEHSIELDTLDAIKANLDEIIQINMARKKLIKFAKTGNEAVEWCQQIQRAEGDKRIDSDEKTGSVKTSGQLNFDISGISFDWPQPKAILQLYLAESELEICA